MKFKGPLKYAYYALFTIVAAIILLSAFLVVGAHKAHAQSGSSLWKLSGLNLSPVNSTWNLKIPGLNSTGSTRCVNVDSTGLLGVAAADCGTGGGGSSIILDLADNGANESTALAEIATSGDTNSIFSEPSADKLLINLGLDWPKADQADALAANGSNCSAGSGALGVDASGAAESCTDFEEDLSNSAGLAAALSDETGTGLSVFATLPTFFGFNTGNGATSSGFARFLEDTDNGSNYWQLSGPTAIGSNVTCAIDVNGRIPDSCVGDGSDADTATPSAGLAGAIQVSDGAGAFLGSLIDNFYYDDAADVLYLLDETTTYFKAGDYSTGFNFYAGGITASTIRTYAGPNLDGTLALTSGAQSFSDKTIDSDVNTLSVDPDEFKAIDSPADEECYTYESTGTTGEWQTCGGGGGAPTDADYLVGTANGSLSAEIVVGTSPGGELGGTWASPTLDDSVAVTSWNLTTPTITTRVDLGVAGVRVSDDGDGALTFLGIGDGASDFDEDLTINFMDTTNTISLSSSTGVTDIDFGTIDVNTDTLDLTGTGTINGLDAVDATTESTIESIIDTLANLTSIQGQAMSFAAPLTIPADPNADRFLFWDDSAGVTAWLTPGNGVTITTTTVAIDSASDTVDGIVELATTAETNTGTDATRAVTPDGLAGSVHGVKNLDFYILDAAYLVTTGDGKAYSRIPSEYNGMNIVGVSCGVHTTSSSGTPTIQLARGRQSSATSAHTYVDVLSTRVTIDASEYDSKDATTAAVINTANDDMATGDMLRWDVDVTGTGTKGLNCNVGLQLP